MSEDTPVNTGVAWPEQYEADLAVRSMQTKLHRWARDDASRRFGDLFNLVCDPAFLVTAWQRVRTNAGARTPGGRSRHSDVHRVSGWGGCVPAPRA